MSPNPAWIDPPGMHPSAELINISKVYGDGVTHNAFTDICRYRDRYYLGFSQGRFHTGDPLNRAVVMSSDDGRNWILNRAFYTGRETEEPKFMVLGATLYCYFFDSYFRDDAPAELKTLPPDRWPPDARRWISVSGWCSYTSDGDSWVDPIKIEDHWKYWRPSAFADRAYCVAHPKHVGTPCKLMTSRDGVHWSEICVLPIPGEEKPNEAGIAFADDGTMHVFIRRDAEGTPCRSSILVSRPPYREWEEHDLGQRLSGPLCFMASGRLMLGARYFTAGGSAHAGLFILREDWTPDLVLALPSAGDCSYLGAAKNFLVDSHDRYLISYYSSHESLNGSFWRHKPSIYVADVAISGGKG